MKDYGKGRGYKREVMTHLIANSLSNKELEHVFEEKDLGVTVDCDLKFDEHIPTNVKKANAIVGLIRRTSTMTYSNGFIQHSRGHNSNTHQQYGYPT